MNQDISRKITPHQLDLLGLNCPLPVLKLRKFMKSMTPGERVEVLASDPLAGIDIPHFCSEAGHQLITWEKQREDRLIFLIERNES